MGLRFFSSFLVGRVLICMLCASCAPATAADATVNTALGLPSIKVLDNNLPTPARSALGQRLFFDKRLSADSIVEVRAPINFCDLAGGAGEQVRVSLEIDEAV